MVTPTKNKHLLFLSILCAVIGLVGLAHIGHAQIDPHRPQANSASSYGFTGASTSDDLVVFDMVGGFALTNTIDLLPEGNYPYDATLNRDGSQVWLAGASGEGLVVVDAITPTIVTAVSGLGDYPVDVAFSEHGEVAFLSSRNTADDILIIDTATYATVGNIPIPDYYLGAGKMRVNQCTGELYAVNWYDDHFFVIDPVSQMVTAERSFGDSLWDLAIDPTATTLYIADRGTPDVVHVFDIATITTTTSIPVGIDPWGIDITPDGRYLLVANQGSTSTPNDSTVSVIDTSNNTVTTTIFLDANADARDIDINAEGTYAYVTSGDIGTPDTVYVIDLTTFQVVDTIDSPTGGGSNPNVIAVAPDFASLDPVAAFTSTTPVPLGTAVYFYETTSNTPTSWDWDFGDGLGNSTDQNPIYNYANPGTYTVTLTTENACGASTTQNAVTVTGDLPPDLHISKTAPITAEAGALITYTLTVSNSGGFTATNLIISDGLPIGASYISGGILITDTVQWQISQLPPAETLSVQFVVTASQTITNSDYAVTADANISAMGKISVVTIILPPIEPPTDWFNYLPFVARSLED
jgi:uncharacterized repeat protein (TIGR01451 family)